jgi:hypothetical protein
MGLTLKLFIQDRVPVRAFIFWELVGGVLALFALFPGWLDWLMSLVGVQHRAYFMLTVGLLGLYVVVYSVFMTQRKIEKDLMRFAQTFALSQFQQSLKGLEHRPNEDSGHHSRPE